MTMLRIFIVVLVCSLFNGHEALKCMTCQGSTSFEECDVNGQIRECMPNQNSCETVVRRMQKERQLIFKQCKEQSACNMNQLQNTRLSGRSKQCNSDQTSSFCTCCCDTDICNIAAATCHSAIVQPLPGNNCPSQPKNIPHGEITCYNGNKPGSVCQYKCSDVNYFVYPFGQETNVCRNNGTWEHETPCCGRNCPPYLVYDFGCVFHVSIPGGRERIVSIFKGFFEVDIVAEDSVKVSLVFFGDTPIESSVIKFNEYETSKVRFIELVRERAVEKPKGSVNLGAAIKFALDNLMTPEAGVRNERVQKAISIFTDHAADDDAIAAANEVRKRGYTVFLYYMGKAVSNADREQFNQIANGEDYVFFYDEAAGNFGVESGQFLKDNFCTQPCDHVVHEHDST